MIWEIKLADGHDSRLYVLFRPWMQVRTHDSSAVGILGSNCHQTHLVHSDYRVSKRHYDILGSNCHQTYLVHSDHRLSKRTLPHSTQPLSSDVSSSLPSIKTHNVANVTESVLIDFIIMNLFIQDFVRRFQWNFSPSVVEDVFVCYTRMWKMQSQALDTQNWS